MQEVEGVVVHKDYDYAHLRGDTGPLVYPGLFVGVFAVLRALTDNGANILRAQFIFLGIYALNELAIVLIYARTRRIPPYVVVLLALSKRVHSIFVLRLFNDCVAMLLAHAALLCLLWALDAAPAPRLRRTVVAAALFSCAIGVKMNVLLMAPGLLLVLLRLGGALQLIVHVAVIVGLQALFAAPFAAWGSAANYANGAFEFGRVFMFKWTVNLKFLGEELFLDKRVALALLAAHLAALLLFLFFRFLHRHASFYFFFMD